MIFVFPNELYEHVTRKEAAEEGLNGFLTFLEILFSSSYYR